MRKSWPVRPGKTDGARRPRGNAGIIHSLKSKEWIEVLPLLGVVWSFTEVVSKLPPWRDVVVLGVPLLENATVFSGDQDRVHTKRRKGWGWFRGGCWASRRPHRGLDSPRERRTSRSLWRAWWSSRGTWQRSCLLSLRGEVLSISQVSSFEGDNNRVKF